MTFTSGLTLLFIAAKLFGAITWPWLYVLAPGIVSFMLLILVLTVAKRGSR